METVTAVMTASPTENKANLFGLVATNWTQPRARKPGSSPLELTDGSSHSCPEPRVRQRAWVSKGEKGKATLMASAFSLVDDAGIQFKDLAAEIHQLAGGGAR